ncbi:MAG: polyprenyl synthetase family protein [Actinomycetota bacterium]|nr:MAG: polyprenyl synthetase family protein [Actinomycetota bacterium]
MGGHASRIGAPVAADRYSRTLAPVSSLDAADLRVRVQQHLDGVLAAHLPALGEISPDLLPLLAALRDLLAGGKRLRPAFCYWGWRGAGQPDCDQVVAAAASLELLHACALLHDDVMDGSDTRRGQPAAHRRFAALHDRQAWQGSADRFGVGAAILLGDLCLSWADEVLLGCGLPGARLAAAKRVYDTMRTELMAGQYLDLLEQARCTATVEGASRVMRFKTAKYTVERPLHLGAALAGGSAALLTAYSEYGLPLGEAFQLRDDVLGVFGDPQRTGKPAGDDLREGKQTMLVAFALAAADARQASRLQQLLGDPGLSDAGVDSARELIVATGALDLVERRIAQLADRAVAALETGPVAAESAAALRELAAVATVRVG